MQNTIVDLSGVITQKSQNPYDSLIDACGDRATEIQLCYDKHRKIRNEQQKLLLQSPQFLQVRVDPVLEKLEFPDRYPGFIDPRNCLVFWARPPEALRNLTHIIQLELTSIAPSKDPIPFTNDAKNSDIWLMPLECLHMTTLEITHSMTELEIEERVRLLLPKAQEVANFTLSHRAKLVRPMLSYDAAAVALSFVPVGKEGSISHDENYTYHHLRRDIYELCKSTGVEIASRYVVPSSHITIARFVTPVDFQKRSGPVVTHDPQKMQAWIERIESMNKWLEEQLWPRQDGSIPTGGEWVVGQEKGLDFRRGTLWYGEGTTICLGEGF